MKKPDKSDGRSVSKRTISWADFYRQRPDLKGDRQIEDTPEKEQETEPPAPPPETAEPEPVVATPSEPIIEENEAPPVVVEEGLPEPVIELEPPEKVVADVAPAEPATEPEEDAFEALLALLKDKEIARNFGLIVRGYLKPRHTSQTEAARVMKYVNNGVFNNVLDGRRPWNELRLRRLCKFLGVDAATLLKQAR